MYNQCLAWDGRQLAALESYGVETGSLRFFSPENNNLHFEKFKDDPKLGNLLTILMSAPTIHSGVVENMLSTLSISDFVTFYRRATHFGLLKKDFNFLLIAVFQTKVIALDVHANQSFFIKGNFDTPIAIGADAAAALALMHQGVPAHRAVASQSLSIYRRYAPTLERSCSLTIQDNGNWRHETHENITLSLPGQQVMEAVFDESI